MGVGVDRLRAGAEAGDGPLQAVVEDAAGALCRGQVPAGALEEVGAGVLDPGGLGPGQRVAADEALVVAERGDQLALGRADVGDDGRRGRWPPAPRRACAGSAATGPAQKTTSAPSQASAIEPAARSSAPSSTARASVAGLRPKPTTSAPSRRRAASPIEPPIRPTPRTATLVAAATGQLRRASTAEAKRSRTVTVSSQSMQASVIDWP